MTDGRRDRVENRLVDLGRTLAYPVPDPALAARVTTAIRARDERGRRFLAVPRARRSLLVALILLLVLATVAAAVGLGLTGIRIDLVPGRPAPSPTAAVQPALGTRLGARVDPANLSSVVDFPIAMPGAVGAPDAAYVDDGRVSLVWLPDADLPEIDDTGVGLVLTQFEGDVDEGYYEKIVFMDVAVVEPVRVREAPGFWISGETHALVYRDADGRPKEETRRMVGDVLIWERGDRTYRLESALGKAATIDLAATIRTDT